jgi:hypothetical protein
MAAAVAAVQTKEEARSVLPGCVKRWKGWGTTE